MGRPQEIADVSESVDPEGRPALDTLFPLVYEELKILARRRRRHERADHSLNTTGLVHEAYVRLVGLPGICWQNRAHVLALAAQAMRRVLVDHARARLARKRGGQPLRVSLDDALLRTERPIELLLAVETGLQRLEALNPRLSRVVECRFFAGMSIEETATALGSSAATVKRDWSLARAWLNRELAEQ
jgi:RNA polymerase sigma factor (TIGR02999 family)